MIDFFPNQNMKLYAKNLSSFVVDKEKMPMEYRYFHILKNTNDLSRVSDIFIDLNPSQVVQIAEYLDFIKRINLKYPELLSKDRGNYIDLIIEILKTYQLVNDSISDQEMQRKLYINIYKFFFNEEPLI
jgi:hypothetical protein